MAENIWPYPGSRWWKFDFHTHTPASSDTPWQINKLDLTPEQWLLKYMAAEIDAVAITDHNSGDWVDPLKAAYAAMKAQADQGTPPSGFRELTLFPGVEISVSGGIHLLAILSPEATTRDIDALLVKVGYSGTRGASDEVTHRGPAEVVRVVLESGGIAIPAHADRPGDKGKALLAVHQGTRECCLDANTVRGALDVEGLLAVEWEDLTRPFPACVEKQVESLARVLGSDSHNFQGSGAPGLRFTWVKMAAPTLEGLRLALLDGNGVSIRRSDEGGFTPFKIPAHFITAIEVMNARFMGNGRPERLELTPYYNALIGGRGAGKSTLIHAIRLAFRRDDDLRRLGEEAEPRRQFERFRRLPRGRGLDGALREETEVWVELIGDGTPHRLRWRADGQGAAVEERVADGRWVASISQAINAERFPIRLFSQGQIAALAGDDRQALLDVIDDTAGIAPLHRALDEARRTYFAQGARLRELDGRLSIRPEVERKLAEVSRKLETFSQSHHAEVLKAHQLAQRQRREVEQTLEQLQAIPSRLLTLREDLLLDDWPTGAFDSAGEAEILAWRLDAEQALSTTGEALAAASAVLQQSIEQLAADARLIAWRQRADQARSNYEMLQAVLAQQGVTDPQAFGRLVQERQQLEAQLKQLTQLQADRAFVVADIEAQWQRVCEARTAITEARKAFIQNTLPANDFVRIAVEPYGFEARNIERSLRELLDVQDDRFESDILRLTDGEPTGGLAYEVAMSANRAQTLDQIKQRLIAGDAGFNGHFRNYLQRKLDKPEFADHLRCWFPEDDLRIDYSREGNGRNWAGIAQGSQGQRSAAMLAFLLAFGDEPLVLDQPEDDMDNHLIYELIVRQIRENKLRRQLVIVTHNPNVVVNGDAELVHVMDFKRGQCRVVQHGALQEQAVRNEVCRVMEGGREAFERRWARLGREL